MTRNEYGKGSVTKRGDKYLAQLYLGRDPVTGKHRYTSKTFTAKDKARDWLRDEQAKRRPVETAETVAAILDAWLTHQRHRHEVLDKISESTLTWYESAVKVHLRDTIGTMAADEVTSADIARVLTDRMKRGGPKGRPLGKSSIRRLSIVLRAAFKYAVGEGWLARSPADQIELPKMETTKSEERVWPIADVRRFLDATAGTDYGVLWRVLAVTGLRRGEALGLTWAGVVFADIGDSSVNVTRAYTVLKGRPVWSEPKTDKSRRRVPIDTATATMLEAVRDRQREAFGPDWSDTFPVFSRPDLVPFHPNEVTRTFQRTARELGLPAIGPHGLRHSVATELGEQGVPLTVVSKLLGHSSTRVTGDVYSHVFDETAGAAVSRVAKAIDGA